MSIRRWAVVEVLVACVVGTACGGDGSGNARGQDGGMQSPDGPGEGVTLEELGLEFPDGELGGEPITPHPADQELPPDAPTVENAVLDLENGTLSVDVEVREDSTNLELHLQFESGEHVVFRENLEGALPVVPENIVPGWTFTPGVAAPWASGIVSDCHDDSGLEDVTSGCYPTCSELCTPDKECNKWLCAAYGADTEESCAKWMQTATANAAGRSYRADCRLSCSHAVAVLDFHRTGGTKAFGYFRQAEDAEGYAAEQAALESADALLGRTSPEQLAHDYLSAVFDETYCDIDWHIGGNPDFPGEAHPRGLNSLADPLGCTPDSSWSYYKQPEGELWQAAKNYLLCKLTGELPTLPSERKATAPRKGRRVMRPAVKMTGTFTLGGAIMVAKDGSVVSHSAPVMTTLTISPGAR